MSNIYTRPDGIRVMEVEIAWGLEMEAIEFPIELAMEGVALCCKAISLGKEGLSSKLNAARVCMLMSYCNDVIENANNGEDTFILEGFYKEQIEEMSQIINELKQKCQIADHI